MKVNEISSVIIYPVVREDVEKIFDVIGKHKWCILITDSLVVEGIKAHIQYYFPSNKLLIHHHFETQEDYDMFMGTDKLDPRRFVTLTMMDNCTIHMQDMTLTGNDGKKTVITFLYTGMDMKEIDKHYLNFVEKLKKLKEGVQEN